MYKWVFSERLKALPERIRQSVPSTRTGHGKSAVAQCGTSHCRHGQVCRGQSSCYPV